MIGKTLSVIIPVYNLEKYIGRCLDSVCKQTYRNLQIILINDGSTDNSLSICEKYAEKDFRIEVYSQENKGVSSARNNGLTKAKGDYITFVDGDDYLECDAYQKVMDKIEDNDALFFGFVERYEEENVNKIVSPVMTGIVDPDTALYYCFLPLGYHAFSCNKVFRTKLVKDKSFNAELKVGEDECWLSEVVPKLNNVVLINEPLYYYVQREGSAMHSEYKVDEKWLTVLASKKKTLLNLRLMDKSYRLSCAKVYNDLFHLTWYAYCSDDKKNYKMVHDYIKQYRKDFYSAIEYSNKRKIKFFVIELMIYLKFPRKIVEKLGDITTYKTKVLISEGKKI